MKAKPVRTIFTIPLLNLEVMVILNEEYFSAVNKTEEFLGCSIKRDGNESAFFCPNIRRGVIWLGPEATRKFVWHECYHATIKFMLEMGSDPGELTGEFGAYMHEYIVERVYQLFEKHHVNRRKREAF